MCAMGRPAFNSWRRVRWAREEGARFERRDRLRSLPPSNDFNDAPQKRHGAHAPFVSFHERVAIANKAIFYMIFFKLGLVLNFAVTAAFARNRGQLPWEDPRQCSMVEPMAILN